jgi:hypothetical protein
MARLQFDLYGAVSPNTNRNRAGQGIRLPQLSDATVTFHLWDTDDSPLDLTGGAVICNFRKAKRGSLVNDNEVELARELTILNPPGAGNASFDINGSADLADLDINYWYEGDGWFIDSDGNEVQVIKPFYLIIDPAITLPTGPVTVPPSATPLAQGPPGQYAFRYTFDGDEGTDFVVTMPETLQNAVGDDYDVFVQIVEADNDTSFSFPIDDRTETSFRVLLGVELEAGSIVEFGVAPRIS